MPRVNKPGQYLGNEWGARRKDFNQCRVRMSLAFPDLYELGMSNFGLKILYQIINDIDGYMVDRTYAPDTDFETILREEKFPLFAFESREALVNFDLIGFSLQYELTYTNVLNMLELAQLPIRACERSDIFPLIFGGGPSAVNPEPMAPFFDFFVIGDGEQSLPHSMMIVDDFKRDILPALPADSAVQQIMRKVLLAKLAVSVPGVYAPALYEEREAPPVQPTNLAELIAQARTVLAPHMTDALSAYFDSFKEEILPERVLRQVAPLQDSNQPVRNLVPYLSLVHDREVLEVRRGCDRGCRFCQPGYTFLPVRERSAEELVELSKKALANSGHQEYSMLSLCVSDYTSLQESVRSLNREHSYKRTSLSFPSQRADRMFLDVDEEYKAVRRSGITLAPEAGTEKMRKVINKGLSHEQIINAIETAYDSGWDSVKLYFMCGLPFEDDDDLAGIIAILKEATLHCRAIRKKNPSAHKRDIDLTCTISNFVPKPFTPFQWFAQVTPAEFARKHQVLRDRLRESGLRNVRLNVTSPHISLLESVISRGDRQTGEMIYNAYKAGATFDAWDDRLKIDVWRQVAQDMGTDLVTLGSQERVVGSNQAFDIVHIGLHQWWLVREWEKAVKEVETAACTENTCHACGICTELDTHHVLANPIPSVMKKNPFVKELNANKSDPDSHPSLFFVAPQGAGAADTGAGTDNAEELVMSKRMRLVFTKLGDLRFIGHLDLQHLFIRAFRRSGMQMSYTQGFNPSPKLSLAVPLPLFQEGLRELAEIELDNPVEAFQLKERLNRQLPPEIQIIECYEIEEEKPQTAKKSLQSQVGMATYKAVPMVKEAVASDIATKLTNAIEDIMSKEHLFAQMPQDSDAKPNRTAKESPKPKDLRPLIHSITLHSLPQVSNELPWLELKLATGSEGHIKPQDVLDLVCPDTTFRVTRLDILSKSGEPLVPVSAAKTLN